MSLDVLRFQIQLLLPALDAMIELESRHWDEVRRTRDLLTLALSEDAYGTASEAAESLYTTVTGKTALTTIASQVEQIIASMYLMLNAYVPDHAVLAAQTLGSPDVQLSGRRLQ